MTLIGEKQAF